MNEQQIYTYLENLREAIRLLVEHVKELEKKVDDNIASTDKKVNELHSVVYDEIINPANEYIASQEKESRFDDFNEKYGEKLRPFNEDLSALEGEDFDVVRSAFDKYDDFEGEKMGEDEYVEALVEQLGDKLSAIKKSLGVPEDTEITVEQKDGETVVTTEDGEVVASEGETEPVEESVEITDVPEDEEVEDDPDELAAFEEELKKQK